ncbi:hypothetical protein [Parendozoicomonas haliclonae]|uniref:Uncharacterized protein n=1 Tax=Parendozoicomonas haliclonae TaxID=1960125 RepID=A0A1X7AIE2_9GAMM|nr:hypothetical protein [Parendozoicomonas haliclonae]SMA44305.1 hypothetical protein EHSB41UT_01774 [Parendozoicomonas haliclonae]
MIRSLRSFASILALSLGAGFAWLSVYLISFGAAIVLPHSMQVWFNEYPLTAWALGEVLVFCLPMAIAFAALAFALEKLTTNGSRWLYALLALPFVSLYAYVEIVAFPDHHSSFYLATIAPKYIVILLMVLLVSRPWSKTHA